MTLLITDYKFKVLSTIFSLRTSKAHIMQITTLVFFILAWTNTIFVTCDNSFQELPEIISNEVEVLKTTHKISHNLAAAVDELNKIKDPKIANDIFCETCEVVFDQILAYRKTGASKESMIAFFRKLCRIFTDWGPVACDGYINIEIDTVLYILDNKKDLTSSRICAISFQRKSCKDPNVDKWTIDVPAHSKTRRHRHHHHVKASPFKILHLTDFHYDPLYKPGNNADCGVPLCCQESNGPPSKPSNAAGYWGDYHVCDTPWHAVTNFTTYIMKKNESFDFVYYTGDIISHRSWATTKELNTDAIKKLFQHFNDTFKKTPLYPVLGNHEPHPTDFYSPGNVTNPTISTQWVFDLVATEWQRWLPNTTISTIKTGGYYTVSVNSKFRIVALNSNVCYTGNLWLIYDNEDPYGQLKWLVDVLTQAEKNGEKVHILSHIPPGEILCLQQWSDQYRKIVNRFAPIIVAQFNGHTHLDELRLFRDLNDTKKVINVAFNAGSFTTFVGLNPNYRTYDVDHDTLGVLDYDHFTYNLTKANQDKNKSPEWYKLYSFKDAYGLKNTSYASLADLMNRMAKNQTLVQQYFRYQGRDSKPYNSQGCNELCLEKLVCGITAVETYETVKCQQLTKKKDSHHRIKIFL